MNDQKVAKFSFKDSGKRFLYEGTEYVVLDEDYKEDQVLILMEVEYGTPLKKRQMFIWASYEAGSFIQL